MNILIKQNRPADQKYNKFYDVTDEQWLKLTAHDMKSALVDMKLDKQSTCTSTSPMPHLNSHSSPATIRSPMNLELASFKKSMVLLDHDIADPTNFWLSWDPTDYEDIRLLQKDTESIGSVINLPSSTVENLISLWDYMNILIKQMRPADQKYNKFYYFIDEQWLRLTAHDMRSALVDMKLDKQSTYTTHTSTSPMPHFSSHSSPAPMRSPMNLEHASFKKSIKGKPQLTQS